MFLLLIGFVRFIRFNRLYTKPYPNPTVFIKLYPFGLYGIYQNQTILSISVRFGSVRFGFTILNSPIQQKSLQKKFTDNFTATTDLSTSKHLQLKF